MRIRATAVLLALVLILVPAGASAVTVRTADDARTDAANSTTNYGSGDDLNVKYASGSTGHRTFLFFNLATVVPQGLGSGDITAATLRLWVNRVIGAGAFDVYEVAASWAEESITDANAPSLGTRRAQNVAVSSGGAKKFLTVDVTALVRDWLDGIVTNDGIALVPVAGDIDVAFDSKENAGTGHDPQLDVMVNLQADITGVSTPGSGGLAGGGTSGSLSLSLQSSYTLPQTCSSGQVTKWNGSAWACGADDNSGGDITAVFAGSGLSGGATSGDATLGVAAGGIATSMLADSAVSEAKLASSAVSGTKIADGAVTAAKIASGEAVKSLNSLKDAVTLAAGSNISLTTSGNTITVAVTGLGGGAHGQVRLKKNGSNLELCPYNGNQIIVDGASVTVSGSCVALSTSGLSASTTYYIYLYLSGGTQTLEASTTGWGFTIAGIAAKTGDATRTLVGMARTDSSTTWQDEPTQRFVRSWFNSPPLTLVGANLGCQSTGYSGTSYAEMYGGYPGSRAEFLAWADEVVDAAMTLGTGGMSGSNAGIGFVSVGFDGADGEDLGITGFGTDSVVSRSGYGRRVGRFSEGYHYITPTWRNDRANSTIVCTAYGGRVQGVIVPIGR